MFCGIKQEDIESEEQTKKIENYIYSPNQSIGKGNFSQVFRGFDQKNSTSVAIKVISHSSLTCKVAQQLLKNEIQILKQLNHQNVLKCHEVLASFNNCYIITDYYEGGDLEKALYKKKKFNERDINRIVYDVFHGLLYLNAINIVHRDLKVANIFLTANGASKIADFGFAVKANEPFKDIKIGSPIYMSPQGLLLNEYGPKTDVWSFGILIYELLHGDTPLAGCRTQAQLKERILLPPKLSEDLSRQIKHFINLCLTVDPKHRLDIKSLKETPFMRRVFQQCERQKIPKQMSSTTYTSTTNSHSMLPLITNVSTFEEGIAVLHYCRLVHKICQVEPSSILSQWLLNLSFKLQWIRLQKETEKGAKLISIIKEYYLKFKKAHQNTKMEVYYEDVIKEGRRLLHSPKIQVHNSVKVLIKQTQMLQKYSNAKQLSSYAKNSQVQSFLQSKNKNNTHNFLP